MALSEFHIGKLYWKLWINSFTFILRDLRCSMVV